MTTLAAAQKAQQAAEREQRRAEDRLRELVEQHQRELGGYEAAYRERTAGVRESLDVAQRQVAEQQTRIVQLEGDLEAERAAHTSLRESLKPREPEPVVLVEWLSDTHTPASVENDLYEGRAGERAWMPRGAAEALQFSGMVQVLGRASAETSIAATVRGDPPPRTAAELRERAAMFTALANGWEREEAALAEQEQQAEAELAQQQAQAQAQQAEELV